jgi:signal peptidase
MFYAGLAGVVVLILFGTLVLMALAPLIVPGWRSAAIISGSMQPAIRAGDVVVAADHDGVGLGPGTVIVFDDPASGELLTHRIIAVTDDGLYVTQGDANTSADSRPVSPTQVVAVGRLLVPYAALPRAWVEQGNWLALGAAIVLFGFAIRVSAYGLLEVHNPWRVDEAADMTIRHEPLPDVAPEPVVVSPAWRTIAVGDLAEHEASLPAESEEAEEAGA